jgi:NAD(P)H dehydrogenase (quinone)
MKILAVLGNPDKNSLNSFLLDYYCQLSKDQGHDIKTIFLGQLNFNPSLEMGYKKDQALEPDLKKAQDYIAWADYLVISFPIWWYSFPAVMKGFIDRVFLPGFAFKYKKDSPVPKKMLNNKTFDLICTSGSPRSRFFSENGNNGAKEIEKILNFCGIETGNKVLIGSVYGEIDDDRMVEIKKSIADIIIK